MLTAVKAAILPEPEAASPMPGAELVQSYVLIPPVLVVVKLMAEAFAPLHTTWSTGSLTCAAGLTVIVNV